MTRSTLIGGGLMVAIALAYGLPREAAAQAFGSRTLGSGISAPGGGGAFGNNSTSSALNGMSGMGGMSGMNGMSGSTGMAGISSGGLSGNLGNAQQLGANTYARQNAGRFVGADRQDAGALNPFSQAGAAGLGGMNQFATSAAMFSQLQQRMRQQQQNLNRMNQQGGGNRGATQLRIPMRLPPAERGPSGISAASTVQLTRRLTKLPALATVGPIEVLTEGQTVILRGQVATDSDRALAEEIALLEPGVAAVRNELAVGRGASMVGVRRPSSSAREF
jgi:osmotically-inducible protein OsmY